MKFLVLLLIAADRWLALTVEGVTNSKDECHDFTIARRDLESVERVAVITLRPTANRSSKKVVWTEDTVDNEHLNKKKSKCCCIYEKPHRFDESDSDSSDDECEHCFGHVEKRRQKKNAQTSSEGTQECDRSHTITETAAPVEASVELPLQPPPTPPDPAGITN